ncbi:hypothetical protein LT85_4201 [Collimonas arenae]|uniref:DUF6249 domain-containing protein n=1 Tax=Collimonas arenae TaxID=279058 RepID=A0A0A1FI98_9BURK|nr:DUF6249 domain-containing protein [Collimonas arenae]AIY43359.1 hypothetical protein LT85_4201 [Collimonas arenae]
MDTVLQHVAPFLIPIVALFIPIVAIVMGVLARMRRAELMHETVRQLVAQGRDIPPQLLDGSLLADRAISGNGGWRNTNGQLIFGAVNVGAGLGVMIMFYAMRPDMWLWAIGCIPLFIGVALLVARKMESKPAPN